MEFCKLLCIYFFTTLSLAQTIDFDTAANWTAGGTGFNSYSSGHIYSMSINSYVVVFTGGPAMRQTTTPQDGEVGAFGTYAWRLRDSSNVDWRVNLNLTSIDGFSFQVRRWSSSPSPNYNVEYSTNNGESWTEVGLINNSFLDQSSAWKTFSYGNTITGESKIIIRLKANGATNRILIDNFIFENPLPVQLTYFTGSLLNDVVKLNWQTATEINNYGFEIERMEISNQVNASDWQRLGFVQGSGNSNSPKNYTFTDNLLLSNKLIASLQYRLKQIDFDGQFEYSNIVEVIIDKSAQFDLSQNYPNPFNPETTIRFSIPSAEQPLMASLHVYDLLGKLVAVLVNEPKLPGVYEVKFNGSELVSGIYFYKFNVGNFTSVKKLILLK